MAIYTRPAPNPLAGPAQGGGRPVSLAGKEALIALEDDLGGRDVLIETLYFANLDPRGAELVKLANYQREIPLATLCRQVNLSPYEVIKLHKDGALNRGQTIAYTRAAEAMNAIMDDLIVKATDHAVTCIRCGGTGSIDKKVCQDCKGSGERLIEADPKAQTKLLDIMQLGKKAGVGTVIMNKIGEGGSFFDEFVAASDKAMRGLDKSSPVIDGTVTEGSPDA